MKRLTRLPHLSVGMTFVLALLWVIPGRSQDIETTPVKNSLVKGAWALQFQIKGDFTLNSFQGSTFSIKKHTSDGKAWRVGLSLDLSKRDMDGIYESDDLEGPENEDTNTEEVDLEIQRIFYPAPHAGVNLYYGIGPRGYFIHSKVVSEYQDSDTTRRKYASGRDEWGAGVIGVLGVEWFATKSISLLAEYGSSMLYTHYKSSSEAIYTTGDATSRRYNEGSSNRVSFGPNSVKFGLSVYF